MQLCFLEYPHHKGYLLKLVVFYCYTDWKIKCELSENDVNYSKHSYAYEVFADIFFQLLSDIPFLYIRVSYEC